MAKPSRGPRAGLWAVGCGQGGLQQQAPVLGSLWPVPGPGPGRTWAEAFLWAQLEANVHSLRISGQARLEDTGLKGGGPLLLLSGGASREQPAELQKGY